MMFEKEYKSKIDNGFWVIPVLWIFVIIIMITIVSKSLWIFVIGFVFLILFGNFLKSFLNSVSYKIDYKYKTLEINSVFGLNKKVIKIKNISKIMKSNSLVASNASSLDRIKIYTKSRKTSIIVSPNNLKEFVKDIKYINEDIEIDRKLESKDSMI